MYPGDLMEYRGALKCFKRSEPQIAMKALYNHKESPASEEAGAEERRQTSAEVIVVDNSERRRTR
jgi:hypothetical protein